jgi:hypothetical protein
LLSIHFQECGGEENRRNTSTCLTELGEGAQCACEWNAKIRLKASQVSDFFLLFIFATGSRLIHFDRDRLLRHQSYFISIIDVHLRSGEHVSRSIVLSDPASREDKYDFWEAFYMTARSLLQARHHPSIPSSSIAHGASSHQPRTLLVCALSSEIYYYKGRHIRTQLSNHVLHIKHIDLCRHDSAR